MIKIYSQVKPDLLLHIIYHPDKKNIRRQDLTPEEEFIQVAFLHLKENEIISAHKHTPKLATINITQESIIVIRGSINVSLYDVNDHLISEYILKQSDCVITFRGGHKYQVLSSDALVYEHKTGPYLGIDKKMIE